MVMDDDGYGSVGEHEMCSDWGSREGETGKLSGREGWLDDKMFAKVGVLRIVRYRALRWIRSGIFTKCCDVRMGVMMPWRSGDSQVQ